MAKSENYTLKLGLFITLGTIIFIVSIYYLGNSKNIFGNNFKVYSDFENVQGLQKGNNVRYSGITVGSINDIFILNDTTIRVGMKIDNSMKEFIRKDAVAEIGTDGLVGGALVNISPRKNSLADFVSEKDILESSSNIGLGDMLEDLGSTNEKLQSLSMKVVEITDKINEGKGLLGTLLNDEMLAKEVTGFVHDMKKTGTNLEKMTLDLNESVSKIKSDLENNKGILNFVLNDTVVVEDLKNSFAGIGPKIENTMDKLDGIVDGKIDPLFSDLDKSINEIQEFTTNLNQMSNELNSGKGTLGKLLKDEKMEKQMEDIFVNLNESSVKLNENLEALQHNFLFRRYFRKKSKKK